MSAVNNAQIGTTLHSDVAAAKFKRVTDKPEVGDCMQYLA
jgi:hypothetical protein